MQETLNFSEEEQVEEQAGSNVAEVSESHLWVTGDSNLSSLLYFIPVVNFEQPSNHIISVFDCSGEKVNEIKVKFPANKVGLLEADALIADCRVVDGIKQAHLEIVSPNGIVHRCRILAKKNNISVSNLQLLDREHACCFPVSMTNDSKNMITVVNQGRPEAMVRCRLFTGTRTPEIEFRLPEKGCATKQIETEFAEFIEIPESSMQQAYLRIITNSSAQLSVRLIIRPS